MTSESTGVLAPGIVLRLVNAPVPEVRLRASMLSLKILEDELGTINAVNAVLFSPTPTDRIAKLLYVLSEKLKESGALVLNSNGKTQAKGQAKKTQPISLTDLTKALLAGFGSLEAAELELAPMAAPKKAGPMMQVLASCLLHEDALFDASPWPVDPDDPLKNYELRYQWLVRQMLLWTDMALLGDYELAVINCFDEAIPKAQRTREPTTKTKGSPGTDSSGSSPEDTVEATSTSGG